jgi:hypothetical protein
MRLTTCPKTVTRALLLATLVLAACGSDSDDTTSSGSTSTSTTTTVASSSTAAEDQALAAHALLAPDDLPDGGWAEGPPEGVFPNSAELASTVPSCADYVDVVFEGGSEHGEGKSGILGRGDQVLFTYVVVFPTDEGAIAMMDAVSEPAFDECWVDFNEAAALAMPFGIEAASYTEQEPPDVTVSADDVNVEHMGGTITVGGSELTDSCVCVFARSGRGVVEVHSAEPVMDIEERSETSQIAVDKLAATLDDS